MAASERASKGIPFLSERSKHRVKMLTSSFGKLNFLVPFLKGRQKQKDYIDKNNTFKAVKNKCRDQGSNRGPLDLQSNALPTELSRLHIQMEKFVYQPHSELICFLCLFECLPNRCFCLYSPRNKCKLFKIILLIFDQLLTGRGR